MHISYSVQNAKNYDNWLAVDNVIAKISWLTFLAYPEGTYKVRKSAFSIAGPPATKPINVYPI